MSSSLSSRWWEREERRKDNRLGDWQMNAKWDRKRENKYDTEVQRDAKRRAMRNSNGTYLTIYLPMYLPMYIPTSLCTSIPPYVPPYLPINLPSTTFKRSISIYGSNWIEVSSKYARNAACAISRKQSALSKWIFFPAIFAFAYQIASAAPTGTKNATWQLTQRLFTERQLQ